MEEKIPPWEKDGVTKGGRQVVEIYVLWLPTEGTNPAKGRVS